MSESMIERVARALAGNDTPHKNWGDHSGTSQDVYRSLARAAIEAIFKGSRFTEIRGMTVIANPEFPAQYWDGSELLEMLSVDTALNEQVAG